MNSINFLVFLIFAVFSALKHVFYSFVAEKSTFFILLMRETSFFCFLITFHIMTGEFCESIVKTKIFRNRVFGVPGLTVISHNAETERNYDIKNTLEFNLDTCFVFFVFFSFVVQFQLKNTFSIVSMLKISRFLFFN